MNSFQKEDTKLKIIEVANKLFASSGYEGTSIREIANNARVNLAAINYHFENKENLYWKVFEFNYQWMKMSVEHLGQESQSTEELALKIFDFFLLNKEGLLNTFKIFLTNSITCSEDKLECEKLKNFGPPGQEAILARIKRDVGENIPDESCRWAMKMMYSLLVHTAIAMNSSILIEKSKKQEDLKPEAMRESLKHAVRAHLEYLKNNPKLKFTNPRK
ncbi:MAG: TetR/AcrR family transcriptional regulator [Halobacteriovoraceae bacterium]|nr:TetR/AcrR family transcriptional regulator [Halobacteriovoraceae bacterium]MCB9095282.1 TetR/AcrR family transcriptional regulator [Halobacteriovoraceae bacterium]